MIPFFTLERQNKILKKELEIALEEVIKRGIFILGEKVAQFEESFAKYLGVKYAVGVASGTDAISLALLSIGVEKGDEVIIPANSYPTAFAVAAIGAVPRLVDIDLATFNIDPAKIPAAITKKTKAILAVHLYGQPADLTSIIRFIEKSGRKIPVVEDCAQAHGAEVLFAGPARHPQIIKRVGSLGQVACFSFYPTKNLGCFGDGGMVVTNNSEIYERVRLLRMYGEKRRYESVLLGRNSRLDELQAAILLVKLKYLDKWNERRRQIAELYISQFTGPKANIELPFEAEYAKHVYHLFVIRTQKRDTLKKYLEERGMQTAIHYPIPIHLVPSMKFLGYKRGDFPRAEKASHDVLSLPIYPELTDGEVKRVAETSKQFFTT